MTQLDEQNDKKISDADVIVATAAKTLFWLVVWVALFFTLFRFVFPVAAMNLYDDMGNVPRAYDCAKTALATSKGDDKVNARLACVNYSVKLFALNPEDYAEELKKNSEEFLADSDCVKRIALIDEYNENAAPKSIRPNLYSYADYLHCENTRANCYSGNDKLLFEGAYLKADDVLAECASRADLSVTAVVRGQISVMLEEYAASGRGINGAFDAGLLCTVARDYIMKVLSGINDTPTLNDLYLVKAYEKLVTRMTAGNFAEPDVITLLKNVEYDGANYTVDNLYYKVLLPQYCK